MKSCPGNDKVGVGFGVGPSPRYWPLSTLRKCRSVGDVIGICIDYAAASGTGYGTGTSTSSSTQIGDSSLV